MIKTTTVAILIATLIPTLSYAKPRHRYYDRTAVEKISTNDNMPYYNSDGSTSSKVSGQTDTTPQRYVKSASYDATVIGGRPAGCPHRFCGCEASLYLWGKIDPFLNLASNWIRRFERTEPAPRMAAARNGHVMVLISHVEGSKWLVHDGNSGGGKIREHVRSIDSFTIVNPNNPRYASR